MKRTQLPCSGLARARVLLATIFVAAAIALFLLWAHGRQERIETLLHEAIPALPERIVAEQLTERLTRADGQARASKNPANALAELGRLYQANGYATQAAQCWRALEVAQPKEAHWPYYLSDLARVRSDDEAIRENLQRTVALDPNYAPAWLRLADWQLKNGQADAAQGNYARRLALVPKDPYARLGLARVALQKGDRAAAGVLLADLVQDTPAFSTGHNLYAEYLEAKGDSSGASRQRWLGRETGRYREVDDPWLDELTERCYDYQRLLVLGTLDFQTERGDKGEHFFRRALQVDPRAYPAYEELGRLYLKNHDAARARDILEEGLRQVGAPLARQSEKTISRGSSRPSALYYVNLSQAYRDLKQAQRAVEVAREGLLKLGDGLELEDALGVALGAEGNYDEAIGALQRALVFNINDSDSNYNLALCLRAVGRESEALKALHRSLILQPTFPSALLILAKVEMEAGHLEDAEKYIQPLYESHPEMSEVRDLALEWRMKTGKAAENRKDYTTAEHQYRAALSIAQNDPSIISHLGVMLLVAGQPQQALPWLEEYHKIQPSDARGALFLGQAYAMQGRFPEARKVLSEGITVAEQGNAAETAAHLREILRSLP